MAMGSSSSSILSGSAIQRASHLGSRLLVTPHEVRPHTRDVRRHCASNNHTAEGVTGCAPCPKEALTIRDRPQLRRSRKVLCALAGQLPVVQPTAHVRCQYVRDFRKASASSTCRLPDCQ